MPASKPTWPTLALLALALTVPALGAEPVEPGGEAPKSTAPERWSLHFQATAATQWHPTFPARYSGANSLQRTDESATSLVTDLFGGLRLWPGGEAYFQPELSGGSGLSGTRGVAAFTSGEVYRVGNPTPTVFVGRLFLRQTFGLGGGTTRVEPGPFQLAGTRDRDALTITLGKVTTTDFVDRVPLASDPHTQFTSWGLWASAAYDYPADVRGYTYGVAVDLSIDWWSVRGGAFLEPKAANGTALEWDVTRARGVVGEVEARYSVGRRPGAVRALGFLNTANMGSYEQALADARGGVPDVTTTRAQGRQKAGLAASVNQDLGAGLGVFLRLSWADGHHESWAFTEIERSVAAGAVQEGSPWGRPDDALGLALVVSGISDLHRRYLAAGGYGFIIGDGALRYAPEVLGEAWYRLALTREIAVIGTYQGVGNPAYNLDRGPVQVLTGRVHVEF